MAALDGNIFLISGNDDARIASEAAKIFNSLTGNNPDPFGSDIYAEGDDGPNAALINGVIRALKSPSFLGGLKTVWLKHFSGFPDEGDKKSTTPVAVALRELADFIKQGLPQDMALVMDGPGIDKRKAVFKACADKGKTIFLDKPDMAKQGWQYAMMDCIRTAAAEKGLKLASQAEDFLLDVLGTDTARINAELEKIICFRGGTEGVASLAEVQEVCVGKGEEMAWALANMLGQRNIREALRVIDVLITQNNENDQYARSMLNSSANFFRQAIRIKVFMTENKLKTPVALKRMVESMSPEDKTKAQANGMDFISYHPFRIQMLASQTERYAPFEMINAIKILKNALLQTTSSSTSPRMALESALLEIIGAGNGANWRA